jgi:hypothetical protein
MEWTRESHAVLLSLVLLATFSVSFARLTFYVAPDGSDENNGGKEAPFATLPRARDAIRSLEAEQRKQDVAVILRGGTYVLDETFVLGLEDGGRNGRTVSYEAHPGVNAVGGPSAGAGDGVVSEGDDVKDGGFDVAGPSGRQRKV